MPRVGLDTTAVVGAAARLADDHGLGQLTLARLAGELGVGAPSLYAHVGGLEDLRTRIATRAARELTAAIRSAAAGRSGRDALIAMAATYRAYARSHPGSYASIQRAPPPQGDPEHEKAAADLVDTVVAVLSGYGLEGDDAIHGARIVRAVLHGFVTLEQEGGFAMDISRDESYRRLLAMLDGGLRATARPLQPHGNVLIRSEP
jgi:AcrR family transcriptional regulator